MTSKTLKSAIWLTLVAGAVALAAGGAAYGKGGRPGGEPPDAGGNKLAVPAVVIGGPLAAASGCGTSDTTDTTDTWGGLVMPQGDPAAGFPISPLDYYYVQGVNVWQAQCTTAVAGFDVVGAWGDNLTGDAKLKAGSPIRVELLLWATSNFEQGLGFDVVKLDPAALDRVSAYGTLAEVVEGGGYSAIARLLTPVVYDAGARLSIQNVATGEYVKTDAPIAPEINATGKVTYGYNLRVTSPGQYLITFTMPNVVITGCDGGECANQTAQLTITVGGGGGGGGGGGKGRPTDPGE